MCRFSARIATRLLMIAFVTGGLGCPANWTIADEGLWLFEDPPRDTLVELFDFQLTEKWLNRVQKSCVRFVGPRGVIGSGAVVSSAGLLVSNQHVIQSTFPTPADPGEDYVRNGFYAATRADELACPGLEAWILSRVEDVTDKVQSDSSDTSQPQSDEARRARIAEIESKANSSSDGYHCEVVAFDGGYRYHLYCYKKLTDVRLVFAPEKAVAHFGGDPLNFEYPRYSFDVCFLRAYEDGAPYDAELFLAFSDAGCNERDLVFVAGCPTETYRQKTVDELVYLRDVEYPFMLRHLYRWEIRVSMWILRSEENRLNQRNFLELIQNSRKAREARLAGLLNNSILSRRERAERELISLLSNNPKTRDAIKAWEKLRVANAIAESEFPRFAMLEGYRGFVFGINSRLFGSARTLIRYAAEERKPNSERLPKFRNENREALKSSVLSEYSIDEDYEALMLGDSLTTLAELLSRSPSGLPASILANRSPIGRARQLVAESTLHDVEVRRALFDGGPNLIERTHDPMLELARTVDQQARESRKVMEVRVESVRREAYREIAKARALASAQATYPEGTSTLRLSFGVVAGYDEGSTFNPYQTTVANMFALSQANNNQSPYDIPDRWIQGGGNLDPQTPLNFVCTADTIIGNSGSPVMDRSGAIVGIYFDGNIQSPIGVYAYDEAQARSISVDSRSIKEILSSIYNADSLVDELTFR